MEVSGAGKSSFIITAENASHKPFGNNQMNKLEPTIILRDVTEADLPIFYEQQLDPEATQMAAFPSRDRDAFMAHWNNKVMVNPDGIVKTILFDGQVAGNIVSWDQSGEREVGYWIGKEYWGKGIATKALAEFLGIVKTSSAVCACCKA